MNSLMESQDTGVQSHSPFRTESLNSTKVQMATSLSSQELVMKTQIRRLPLLKELITFSCTSLDYS